MCRLSPRRRLDRAEGTQRSEGPLRFHTLGVVASCDQQLGGGVGTDAAGGQQGRVGLGAEASDLDIELCDLGVEDLVAEGQAAESLLRVADRGHFPLGRNRAHTRTRALSFMPSWLVLYRLWGTNHQGMELVGGLGAGLGGGAAGNCQHPYPLDRSVTGLGHRGCFTIQSNSGCCFGVGVVVLASAAA